jgi:hypothetical protein
MALAHFQRTFTDASGNVKPGLSVTVRRESDNGLAALFADAGSVTPKSNPFSTDASGYGSFYVVGGRYRIQATDIDWRNEDIFYVDQAITDHVALADPHSQYADQANTYTETEVDELTGSLAYPSTTLASSSAISESVEPAIAAYPHIQGFRTGTGTALTFAQAVEEAAERGARLLTIQELEAGVAAGAGFTYDNALTWTSSPAGVGLVYGTLGDGNGTRVVLNTNTDTAAGGYAVSVIGQRQWTDTQYAAIAGQTFTGDIAAPKITASTGVLFGTDTAAANTLDDYEEGAWTPTIASGASAITYARNSGTFTKIGNKVFFTFDIEASSATATSDYLKIGGLPFQSSSINNTYGTATIQLGTMVDISAQTTFGVHIKRSSLTLDFFNSASGLSGNSSGILITGRIIMTGQYTV